MRLALLCLPLLVACSHKHAATTVAAAAATPPPAQTAKQEAPVAQTKNLAVDDDLARACSLHLDDVKEAPKFDYDESSLLPEDRSILEQVATCVTRGPMKGHKVTLTGRTDPRGTEEYNLALGERRATSVGEYLGRLGVPATQLAETTRGEIDARGTDDGTWRVDRRVDIKLAN